MSDKILGKIPTPDEKIAQLENSWSQDSTRLLDRCCAAMTKERKTSFCIEAPNGCAMADIDRVKRAIESKGWQVVIWGPGRDGCGLKIMPPAKCNKGV